MTANWMGSSSKSRWCFWSSAALSSARSSAIGEISVVEKNSLRRNAAKRYGCLLSTQGIPCASDEQFTHPLGNFCQGIFRYLGARSVHVDLPFQRLMPLRVLRTDEAFLSLSMVAVTQVA